MNTLIEYRASFFKKVRSFFDERGYLEVDSPALATGCPIDVYIDPLSTHDGRYLHTSPECAMKRLLTEGVGDIYFLGHVFRKEECGSLHNSEFTMAEWYKTKTTEKIFIDEVLEFLSLFLGPLPVQRLSYEEALGRFGKEPNIPMMGWNEDEKRHYTWATAVEPSLGNDCITVIHDFLPSDAALAKLHRVNGHLRAARFEFYYKGIELANGFAELSDPEEQEKRFIESNEKRRSLGKKELPIDYLFLSALKKGFPENTYGMAAGFDRLLMLHYKKENLRQILPFHWDNT